MIKKICLLSFFLLAICRSFAQDISTQIPNLLPVSATSAHLIKVGLGSTKLPTGAATANFPLYELHEGTFTMPISLSYFSQGNKREEQCTRTGFGWSLVAGGVITRKVKGVADELGTRFALPADLTAQTQENLDAFNAIANTGNEVILNGGLDTQPDEFSFSFNGMSGFFYFDDSGVPVTMSDQNLKISVVSAGIFRIVTTDGTQYWFGDDNYDAAIKPAGPVVKTAFYLYKIILENGDIIHLNYSRFLTNSVSGFTEIIALNGDCGALGTGSPTSIATHTWSYQATQNWSCMLMGIVSENQTINFGYAPINDGSNDQRLTDIQVKNQNNRFIKQYHLSYLDVIEENSTTAPAHVNNYHNGLQTSIVGTNGRFYLTNIMQTYTEGVDGSESINYPLEYYGDIMHEDLSVSSNYAQDLHGFKNGKSNQTLFPLIGSPTLTTNINWADRSPDWNASVTGMLKKIRYPTKGEEEFFYEPNAVSVTEPNPPDPRSLDWTAHLGEQIPLHYITVNHNQLVRVVLTAALADPNCVAGHEKQITLTIRDVTTNTLVNTATVSGGDNPLDYTFSAEQNHQYSFQTYVFPAFPSCSFTFIHIQYDETVAGTHTYNKEESGVRVKEIIQTDQLGSALKKYFFYNSLADPQKSSGITNLNDNINGLFKGLQRGWQSYYALGVYSGYACADTLYMSNGIFNATTYEHSHIWYTHVIVSDDVQFNNGGTEYTFYEPPVQEAAVTKEGLPPVRPEDLTITGFPDEIKKEISFDKNFTPIQVKENNYEYAFAATHYPLRNVYIKKMYDVYWNTDHGLGEPGPPPMLVDYLFAFDVTENFLKFNWPRLHDTKITKYDKLGHSFETTVTYDYNNPDNVLPASVTTTDSKQQSLVTYKKYPTDFPADPVFSAMTAANIISPLVEESTTRAGIEIAKTDVTYADNGSSGGGFQPAVITQNIAGTPTPEDKIIFSAYDNVGNLKEVAKSQDSKISYLWDYHQSLVTAEVKNAVKEDIAYTSFESDSKGNFSFSGMPVVDVTAPTGGKAYDLTSGAISFPGNTDLTKHYIVSYWSKGGGQKSVPGSVNVITGSSVQGWTYYEHHINTMPANNTIGGFGVIDELRLYPADAMMTTFTYEPLVGQTSQCDVNNRITYYDYDGLQRLVIIRNQDKNIVKKICYNYAGQPQNCSGIYTNVEKSQVFTRNNCDPGATGGQATYVVPANLYTANTQAGADELALNDITVNGQAYANVHGSCSNLHGNFEQVNSWVKNDCSPGMVGSTVSFTVPADTYYANTQAAANQLANAYLNANGQAYANAHGTCSLYVCSPGNCHWPDHLCINSICETGMKFYISSQHLMINGVWQYSCTYIYCFSNTTTGPFSEYRLTPPPSGGCAALE